jgi:hypothetical protein
MFYCETCGKKNGWPESFVQSRGQCEMCGETAVCFDVPSKHLPKPLQTEQESETTMPDELKPCPFCGSGSNVLDHEGYARCSNSDCWMSKHWIGVKLWNTRPQEDALRARLEAAEDYIITLEVFRAFVLGWAEGDSSFPHEREQYHTAQIKAARAAWEALR